MSEELSKAYEQAAATPVVPYWVQLVSGLAMAGLKVMPSHLIAKAGRRLSAIADSYISAMGYEQDFYAKAGFILVENHCRSESHEEWQSGLGDKHKGKWVIPVDEILAIDCDDPQACDYVSIQRLLFEGTEEELTKAIDGLGTMMEKFKRPQKETQIN